MGLIRTTSTDNHLKKLTTDAESSAPISLKTNSLIIDWDIGNLQAFGVKATLNVAQNTVGFGAILSSSLSGLIETCASDVGTVIPGKFLALEPGTGLKKVLIKGYIRNDAWSFSPGQVIYVSTISGVITNSPPVNENEYIQVLGYAVTSNIISFDPDKSYQKLSENKVPLGLIIPFNDISVPAGWDLFTMANDKMIVGAGSTYNPGDTGGDMSFPINEPLGSGGSHLGTDEYRHPDLSGTQYLQQFNEIGGTHSHTAETGSYLPNCNDIILIKSNSSQNTFPQNGILLSDGTGTLNNVVNILNNNRFIRASATIGTSGSATTTVSANGSHAHDATPGPQGVYVLGNPYSTVHLGYAGSHSPISDINIIESIKKVQLSAWTNATQAFNLQSKMIGMWESLTPPNGWVLCDGTNGTFDLRDYFIQTTTDGLEATGSGNNTIDVDASGGITHSASHTHWIASSTTTWSHTEAIRHGTYTWSHTHAGFTKNGIAYLPPYYALSFIMRS